MSALDKRWERLRTLAGEICIFTPEKQHKHSVCAQVPWELIHELREVVEDLGIDLKHARGVYRELEARRKAREAEEIAKRSKQ